MNPFHPVGPGHSWLPNTYVLAGGTLLIGDAFENAIETQVDTDPIAKTLIYKKQ